MYIYIYSYIFTYMYVCISLYRYIGLRVKPGSDSVDEDLERVARWRREQHDRYADVALGWCGGKDVGRECDRGTSLMRNHLPLGPCSRTTPRALW